MIMKKGLVLAFHKENGALQLGELIWIREDTFFVVDPNNPRSKFTFREDDIACLFQFYYNPDKLEAEDYMFEYAEYMF